MDTARIVDRRAEAHLWLSLEEAVAMASAPPGSEPAGFGPVDEARRWFGSIADALIVVGAIDAERAQGIVRELDDVLSLRGALGAAFAGRRLPPFDPDSQPVRRNGEGWLEAQIEHHLDLIVDLDPQQSVGTGRRLIELLRPGVRALQTVGSLRRGEARLADLAATLDAAGYDVDRPFGEVDRGWLTFLRDRPAQLVASQQPAASVEVDVLLGTVGGPVTVRRVSWSEALLEVVVTAPVTGAAVWPNVSWRCSVFDDHGHLHLGLPGVREHEVDDGPLRFRLRPGLMAGVRHVTVRLTRGPERLEEGIGL